MTEAFQTVLAMSFSASWLIIVILALRFLLRRMPKWGNVLLWGLAALRLLIPVTIESRFSLIPAVIYGTDLPAIDNIEVPFPNHAAFINPGFHTDAAAGLDPVSVMCLLWIIGVLGFALYFLVNYFRFMRRLDTAVLLRENIYQSDVIDTSVVIGILRPKICVPFNVSDSNLNHIIAHERSHIRRRDHLWKLVAYTTLMLHWFNPFVWIAYWMFGRDLELACDEAVICDLSQDDRADYAQTLVTYSTRNRTPNLYPLCFGEIGVKVRVKSVMNYRRSALRHYVMLASVCLLLCCCFLTNPARALEPPVQDDVIQEQQEQETAVHEPIKDLESDKEAAKEQSTDEQTKQPDLRFEFAVRVQIENYQKVLESMKLELIEIEAQYENAKSEDRPPLKELMDHYAYWIEQLEANIQSAQKQLGIE